MEHAHLGHSHHLTDAAASGSGMSSRMGMDGMSGGNQEGTTTPGMDNMDHMAGGGSMDGMDMGGMMMYFHTGFTEYVLFEKAHTTTRGELAGACVVVAVAAVLYELLKFYRDELFRHRMDNLTQIRLQGSPEEKVKVNSPVRLMFSAGHAMQTLLHLLQITASYLLMLVVMTYNVYLALSVVLGATLGYFLVGWKRSVNPTSDQSEHCH